MAPITTFLSSIIRNLLHSAGSDRPTNSRHGGYSLLEMLVVLMMASIVSNVAVGNLKELNNPLQNGSAQLAGFLKQVRAKAISQTVAYRVHAANANTVTTSFANSCAAGSTTTDPLLTLTLPNGTSLGATDFDFCFSSRGLADQNVIITLHDGSGTKTVEIMLGGGVKIQ